MPPTPDAAGETNPSDAEEEDMEEIFEIENEIELDENDYDPGDDMDELDVEDDVDEENGYLPDDALMAFQKHEGSVFCVNFHPTKEKIVITGGEDDKAYLWNTDTGEVCFECTGHKDSIIGCGFSYDGKYSASIDMGGVIIVWLTDDGKKVWDFECSDIEWFRWHPKALVLFTGTTDGDVYMFKVPSGECKICASHGIKTTTGEIMPNGTHLLAGYDDGSLKIWDLKTASSLFNISCDASISCITYAKSGNLIAAGSLNGSVNLISNLGKVIGSFRVDSPTTSSSSQEDEGTEESVSIESLTFSPDDQLLAVGSLNGKLSIWDVSSKRFRHHCEHPHGISRIIWNESTSNSILTSCLDGVVRSWNSRSGTLEKEWHGHRDDILDLAISTDGRYILSGSDDKTARIFER